MIDEWERIVYNAVLSGGISRSTEKRLNPKKYFDAEKARKEILNESIKNKPVDLTKYQKAMESLKNFKFSGSSK